MQLPIDPPWGVTSEFVPPKNETELKEWKFRYNVDVRYNDRKLYLGPYSMGCLCGDVIVDGERVERYQKLLRALMSKVKDYPTISDYEEIKKVMESGKYYHHLSNSGCSIPKGVVAPVATDVVACILMDADAINYQFDEWCDSYGYSSDSIKAKGIYDTCLATGIVVNQVVPKEIASAFIEKHG